jgi:dihydroneopterin aldolase
MSNKDFISIKGLRGIGHHGVFEEERTRGQEFIVDVELHFPLEEAGKNDDITKTVDYGLIAIVVNKHIIGEPVNLIETVAQNIATEILENKLVQKVVVTVHKPNAPIAVDFSDVCVTISRKSDD